MQNESLLLDRAKIYEVVSLAFRSPTQEIIERIRDSVTEFAEALTTIGVDADTHEKGMAFITAGASTDLKTIKHDNNQFYVGRQQCRLDESEYDTAMFHRSQRMADIGGFYNAFGFKVAEDSYSRPDFVGTELEFMHLLLLKRAYAIEQDWPEHAEVCAEAELEFLKEHLEWWIPQLCETLRGASTCAFYRSLSNFLERFIQSEAAANLQPA